MSKSLKCIVLALVLTLLIPGTVLAKPAETASGETAGEAEETTAESKKKNSGDSAQETAGEKKARPTEDSTEEAEASSEAAGKQADTEEPLKEDPSSDEETLPVLATKSTETTPAETEPEPVYALDESVAGMMVALDDYYDAVATGTLKVDVDEDLRYVTDEVLQAKINAVNRYFNLGVVNLSDAGYLNIREEPNTDGEVIGKLTNNCGCDILETLDGWYKIESGGIEGYVSAQYIMDGENARQRGIEAAEPRAIVQSDVLNIRKEPSSDSEIWGQASNRERYIVIHNMGDWIEISLDGCTGFCSGDYVEVRYALNEAVEFHPVEEEQGVSSLRVQIANYAIQFLGNPYVWGGTSLTHGCDCSGFVQSVLKNFGIYIERTSRTQAYCGRQISSGDMQPGDLLFYAKNGSINHVSMYIGNGQVIHASDQRSGIKISTWNYRTPVRIISVID